MDDSGALVDLNMDDPFLTLHCGWLTAHPPGRQQDAAEYAGWLREQFLRQTPWGNIQKGWENRLSEEVVDRGAIYAPILLRCPDQKACHLQDLIYHWHQQAPHTMALTCANPMVCLQIEVPRPDSQE